MFRVLSAPIIRSTIRTVNLTSIKLTHEEMVLLNSGLQHSIEKPLEKYWTELIIGAELAIK
jgi:hypothetical protein